MYYNRQPKYIFKMINSHFSGEYNIEYVLYEIYLRILFYNIYEYKATVVLEQFLSTNYQLSIKYIFVSVHTYKLERSFV